MFGWKMSFSQEFRIPGTLDHSPSINYSTSLLNFSYTTEQDVYRNGADFRAIVNGFNCFNCKGKKWIKI